MFLKHLKEFIKDIIYAIDAEIIALFFILIIFIISICDFSKFLDDKYGPNNQSYTIATEESIDKNNTNGILNNLKEKENIKEPVTQNIVIYNILKEDNNNFLKDININIIVDITATVLIATTGFFIGKFFKKKKVKL